jgi:hypothetical protein
MKYINIILIVLLLGMLSCARETVQEGQGTKKGADEMMRLALGDRPNNNYSFRMKDVKDVRYWPRMQHLWDAITSCDPKDWSGLHQKIETEFSVIHLDDRSYHSDVQMMSYKMLVDVLLGQEGHTPELYGALAFYAERLLAAEAIEWDILADLALKMKSCEGNDPVFIDKMKNYVVEGAKEDIVDTKKWLSKMSETSSPGSVDYQLGEKHYKEQIADAEYALAKLDNGPSR